MIFFCSFLVFIALPSRKDAILFENKAHVNVEASGSIGIYKGGKCIQTHPNETLIADEKFDWCSNIASDKSENTWVQYSLQGKQMKITGYAVRNGCCRYACCCVDGHVVTDIDCCCMLYTYSLQGSNDNKTWTVLHRVEEDKKFYYCKVKTFELPKVSAPFTYFRFVLEKEYPNCPKCMQINQIELYGEAIVSSGVFYDDSTEDESVSIIGKVRKNDQ